MKNLFIFAGLVLISVCSSLHAQFVTIDVPGAYETIITGIEGDIIVGTYYSGNGNPRGFSYDGENWTWIDNPNASYTYIKGISGNKIFGNSGNHSFIYDGDKWESLVHPEGDYSYISDIQENIIVGSYISGDGFSCGFIYDGTDWSVIAVFENDYNIHGIDGEYLVGDYSDSVNHAYVYD